jgi:hypothetical protein
MILPLIVGKPLPETEADNLTNVENIQICLNFLSQTYSLDTKEIGLEAVAISNGDTSSILVMVIYYDLTLDMDYYCQLSVQEYSHNYHRNAHVVFGNF